jgi:hypothetical protein
MIDIYNSSHNIFAEYLGNGILRYDQGVLPIAFRCIQFSDSNIHVYTTSIGDATKSLSHTDEVTMFFDEGYHFQSIQGSLNDGRIFESIGEIWPLANYGQSQIFAWQLSHFRVKFSDNSMQPRLLIFPLMNLFFRGTESFIKTELPELNPDPGRSVLRFRTNGVSLMISHTAEWQQESRMYNTKNSEVTSYLNVPCDGRSIEDLLVLAKNICHLLCFAKGTKITWPYYQILSKNGCVLLSDHQQITMTEFRPIEIIDDRNALDLKNFLETAYDRYTNLAQPTKCSLDKIIETIVWSKQSRSLPELRGLNIASAVDVLRLRWAKIHERTHIYKRKPSDEDNSLLKDCICQFIKERFQANELQIKYVKNKVLEINRPSMKDILKEMITDIQARISEDDIDTFAKSRNSLVHNVQFRTDAPNDELKRLFYFLDCMVLALLCYRSDCIDYTKIPNAII